MVPKYRFSEKNKCDFEGDDSEKGIVHDDSGDNEDDSGRNDVRKIS